MLNTNRKIFGRTKSIVFKIFKSMLCLKHCSSKKLSRIKITEIVVFKMQKKNDILEANHSLNHCITLIAVQYFHQYFGLSSIDPYKKDS